MKKLLFLLVLLPLCLGIYGSLYLKSSPKHELKPVVLVSIAPYQYFVERIAGSDFTAMSLVPEGANPHLFEPTPKQVQLAHEAKVWIRISESFEKKILTSLEQTNKHLYVVNLSEKVTLLHDCEEHCDHHHDDANDLHIWMSARLAQKQAVSICDALSEAFPEKQEQFKENLSSFLSDLKALDQHLTELLLPYKDQAILVSHPAFAYFCHDYDIKQMSIETEGKEPLPQDLTSLIEKTLTTPIRAVLTQVQYNNRGAELLAEKLKMEVHCIDPYSSNYLKTLEEIGQIIAHDSQTHRP